MNKVNLHNNVRSDGDLFRTILNNITNASNAVSTIVVGSGIINGLNVTIHSSGRCDIGAGSVFNNKGLSAICELDNINLSLVTRPASGHHVWVTIAGRIVTDSVGGVVAIDMEQVPTVEKTRFEVVFVLSDLDSADPSPVEDGMVVLCDVKLDANTAYDALTVSNDRRIEIAGVDAIVSAASTIGDELDDLSDPDVANKYIGRTQPGTIEEYTGSIDVLKVTSLYKITTVSGHENESGGTKPPIEVSGILHTIISCASRVQLAYLNTQSGICIYRRAKTSTSWGGWENILPKLSTTNDPDEDKIARSSAVKSLAEAITSLSNSLDYINKVYDLGSGTTRPATKGAPLSIASIDDVNTFGALVVVVSSYPGNTHPPDCTAYVLYTYPIAISEKGCYQIAYTISGDAKPTMYTRSKVSSWSPWKKYFSGEKIEGTPKTLGYNTVSGELATDFTDADKSKLVLSTKTAEIAKMIDDHVAARNPHGWSIDNFRVDPDLVKPLRYIRDKESIVTAPGVGHLMNRLHSEVEVRLFSRLRKLEHIKEAMASGSTPPSKVDTTGTVAVSRHGGVMMVINSADCLPYISIDGRRWHKLNKPQFGPGTPASQLHDYVPYCYITSIGSESVIACTSNGGVYSFGRYNPADTNSMYGDNFKFTRQSIGLDGYPYGFPNRLITKYYATSPYTTGNIRNVIRGVVGCEKTTTPEGTKYLDGLFLKNNQNKFVELKIDGKAIKLHDFNYTALLTKAWDDLVSPYEFYGAVMVAQLVNEDGSMTNPRIYGSIDGVAWNILKELPAGFKCIGVIHVPSIANVCYVMGERSYYFSYNGLDWEERSIPSLPTRAYTARMVCAVKIGNTGLIACGAHNGGEPYADLIHVLRPDGSWSSYPLDHNASTIHSMSYGGGRMLVGTNNGIFMN
jgi:hypothetical protein